MNRDVSDSLMLPAAVGDRFRDLFGLAERPETLADLLRGWGQRWPADGPLDADALYAGTPTRHEVRLGVRVRHTPCVIDALMLPALTREPVEVISHSPASDQPVRIRIGPGGLEDVSPATAVVSFGAADDPDGDVRVAVCPYLNAFATAQECEAWRDTVPEAATVAVPVAEAAALAATIATHASTGQGPGAVGGCCS